MLLWLFSHCDYLSTATSKQNEETNDNIDYQEKIIDLVESQAEHEPDPLEFRNNFLYEPSQTVDLNNFLQRPFPISSFDWKPTDTTGALLTQFRLPEAGVNAWYEKVNYTRFMAPDFEVIIQINGTRMHYGRLLVVVDPIPYTRGASYYEFLNATSAPKWYQVNAGTQQSVRIKIPYFFNNNKISWVGSTQTYLRMVQIRIYVQVPLRSVEGTPQEIDVMVWARMVNPRLTNYTSIKAQSLEEQVKGTKLFKPSTALNAGAKALNFLSSAAQSLGYSNPANIADTNSMQIRQPMFLKADENPNTINLGPSQNCKVGKSVMQYNEPTIVSHCKQFTLIKQLNITTSNSVGDMLLQIPLTPMRMYTSVDGFVPPTGVRYASPAYYYARLFNYWRGSFRVAVNFTCSAFHSLRVRAFWLPVAGSSTTTVIGYKDQSFSNSIIMDINESTDYRFSIPFDCLTNWVQNYNNDWSTNTSNGILRFSLVNLLTAGTVGVPNTIAMQVFMSMDDDFQLASPRISFSSLYGNPDFQAITLREQEEELDDDALNKLGHQELEFKIDDNRTLAQSLEQTVSKCNYQTSSNECLMSSEFPSITGKKHELIRTSYTQSFEFTSPKQIASLLSPLYYMTTDTTKDFTGIATGPFGCNNFVYNENVWYNYFTQMRSIFVLGRGGYRVVAMVDKASIQCHAVPNYAQVGLLANTYVKEISSDPTSLLYLAEMTQGYQTTLDTSLMPMDIILPYYAVPDWKGFPNDTDGTTFPSPRLNVVNINLSVQKTAGLHIHFHSAAANDFEFCYPTTIPRLRMSA